MTERLNEKKGNGFKLFQCAKRNTVYSLCQVRLLPASRLPCHRAINKVQFQCTEIFQTKYIYFVSYRKPYSAKIC